VLNSRLRGPLRVVLRPAAQARMRVRWLRAAVETWSGSLQGCRRRLGLQATARLFTRWARAGLAQSFGELVGVRAGESAAIVIFVPTASSRSTRGPSEQCCAWALRRQKSRAKTIMRQISTCRLWCPLRSRRHNFGKRANFLPTVIYLSSIFPLRSLGLLLDAGHCTSLALGTFCEAPCGSTRAGFTLIAGRQVSRLKQQRWCQQRIDPGASFADIAGTQ